MTSDSMKCNAQILPQTFCIEWSNTLRCGWNNSKALPYITITKILRGLISSRPSVKISTMDQWLWPMSPFNSSRNRISSMVNYLQFPSSHGQICKRWSADCTQCHTSDLNPWGEIGWLHIRMIGEWHGNEAILIGQVLIDGWRD